MSSPLKVGYVMLKILRAVPARDVGGNQDARLVGDFCAFLDEKMLDCLVAQR